MCLTFLVFSFGLQGGCGDGTAILVGGESVQVSYDATHDRFVDETGRDLSGQIESIDFGPDGMRISAANSAYSSDSVGDEHSVSIPPVNSSRSSWSAGRRHGSSLPNTAKEELRPFVLILEIREDNGKVKREVRAVPVDSKGQPLFYLPSRVRSNDSRKRTFLTGIGREQDPKRFRDGRIPVQIPDDCVAGRTRNGSASKPAVGPTFSFTVIGTIRGVRNPIRITLQGFLVNPDNFSQPIFGTEDGTNGELDSVNGRKVEGAVPVCIAH